MATNACQEFAYATASSSTSSIMDVGDSACAGNNMLVETSTSYASAVAGIFMVEDQSYQGNDVCYEVEP